MERNTNEYSELFFHCVEILNQYDEQISEETFLEEYFEKNPVGRGEVFFLIETRFFLGFQSEISFDVVN